MESAPKVGTLSRCSTLLASCRERVGAVSPRPAPTRHDTTALRFLNAAAQLIDASLVAYPAQNPARLKALHYPAALDWIRIEDVLRLAREVEGEPASKRAFTNRWGNKDEFIRDAIIHAMLYRDDLEVHAPGLRPQLHTILKSSSLSVGLRQMVNELINELMRHPRSFLLAHIAPLLPRHPQLAGSVRSSSAEGQAAWTADYPKVLEAFGLRLRPDWPGERLTLAVQIILDGTMVRSRVETGPLDTRWRAGSICSDTVLALVAAAIDTGDDGRTTSQWLDHHVRLRQHPTDPGKD